MPWDERSLIGSKRGLPWWGAVVLGFGLAILGAFVDMKLQGRLTPVFSACYCGGAVLAVCAVQRRGLFGPMVQPPIVQAVTVPCVILLAAGMPAGGDTLATLLKVGQPLIDGFPLMAITTGVTVLIGFFRMYRERDPHRQVKAKSNKPLNSNRPASAPKRPADERPSAGDSGARAGAAGGRARPRPPAADGQAPRRRNPAAPAGSGAAGRRSRPAPEDGAQRPRGNREGGERDPGTRSARRPPEPGARGPGSRQPRAPRDEPGAPRRREPRADGAPGDPRVRRAPRADDPRRGMDNPLRAPGRRGDSPPPRRRPRDDQA